MDGDFQDWEDYLRKEEEACFRQCPANGNLDECMDCHSWQHEMVRVHPDKEIYECRKLWLPSCVWKENLRDDWKFRSKVNWLLREGKVRYIERKA